MITEMILNFIFLPVNALLALLPDITLSIPDGVFDGLKNIFGMLGFIFPIKGLLVILTVSISIKLFHIIWALVIRIKSFIPTMGS